jgi:hypothetical protein
VREHEQWQGDRAETTREGEREEENMRRGGEKPTRRRTDLHNGLFPNFLFIF